MLTQKKHKFKTWIPHTIIPPNKLRNHRHNKHTKLSSSHCLHAAATAPVSLTQPRHAGYVKFIHLTYVIQMPAEPAFFNLFLLAPNNLLQSALLDDIRTLPPPRYPTIILTLARVAKAAAGCKLRENIQCRSISHDWTRWFHKPTKESRNQHKAHKDKHHILCMLLHHHLWAPLSDAGYVESTWPTYVIKKTLLTT